MAKRTWRAGPDSVYRGRDEDGEIFEIEFVSRDRLIEALLDGAVFLDRSGGSFLVTVGRQPTEVPGEALTTGVACQWVDGPRAKAQPEAVVSVPLPAPPVPEPSLEDFDISLEDVVDEPEPAEDLTAVPESMR